MANKDSLKNISEAELFDYIKGLKKSNSKSYNSLISDISKLDSRSPFGKFMFGQDDKFKQTSEAMSSLSDSFNANETGLTDIAQAKKKRYGLFSTINEYNLIKKQNTDIKKAVSGLKLAQDKLLKEEKRNRGFTSSNMTILTSLRKEKSFLKDQMAYSNKMIEKLIKQGHSVDSKQIKELSSVIQEAEKKLKTASEGIVTLKGGEKFREKETQKLTTRIEDLQKELKEQQVNATEEMNKKNEQIQELIKEGFDEDDFVIKELKKGIEDSSKDNEKNIEKLQKEIDKQEKELGYIKDRPRGFLDNLRFGFGFGKGKGMPNMGPEDKPKGGSNAAKEAEKEAAKGLEKDAIKSRVGLIALGTAVAAIGGTYISSKVNDYFKEKENNNDATHLGSLGKPTDRPYSEYSKGAQGEVFFKNSVASFETQGLGDKAEYDVRRDMMDNKTSGIAIGKYQYNLGKHSEKELRQMMGKNLSAKDYAILSQYLGQAGGSPEAEQRMGVLKNKASSEIPKEVIKKINDAWIDQKYKKFTKLIEQYPYLKDYTESTMRVIYAAYNNAPSLIENILQKSNDKQSFEANYSKRFSSVNSVRRKYSLNASERFAGVQTLRNTLGFENNPNQNDEKPDESAIIQPDKQANILTKLSKQEAMPNIEMQHKVINKSKKEINEDKSQILSDAESTNKNELTPNNGINGLKQNDKINDDTTPSKDIQDTTQTLDKNIEKPKEIVPKLEESKENIEDTKKAIQEQQELNQKTQTLFKNIVTQPNSKQAKIDIEEEKSKNKEILDKVNSELDKFYNTDTKKETQELNKKDITIKSIEMPEEVPLGIEDTKPQILSNTDVTTNNAIDSTPPIEDIQKAIQEQQELNQKTQTIFKSINKPKQVLSENEQAKINIKAEKSKNQDILDKIKSDLADKNNTDINSQQKESTPINNASTTNTSNNREIHAMNPVEESPLANNISHKIIVGASL